MLLRIGGGTLKVERFYIKPTLQGGPGLLYCTIKIAKNSNLRRGNFSKHDKKLQSSKRAKFGRKQIKETQSTNKVFFLMPNQVNNF
jgi:hypothetical protein